MVLLLFGVCFPFVLCQVLKGPSPYYAIYTLSFLGKEYEKDFSWQKKKTLKDTRIQNVLSQELAKF